MLVPASEKAGAIGSRLDYCDRLLDGCNKQLVDKLQRVLNYAARVIFGGDRREHVTPLLRDKLHWLRARERITFKRCLLVYKARKSMAPNYIRDLCVPVTTVSTRAALRSAARGGVDWKCRSRKWRTKKDERTENAGLKMQDQIAGVENARPENVGPPVNAANR